MLFHGMNAAVVAFVLVTAWRVEELHRRANGNGGSRFFLCGGDRNRAHDRDSSGIGMIGIYRFICRAAVATVADLSPGGKEKRADTGAGTIVRGGI